MVAKDKMRDLSLAMIGLGALGFFALPDYWMRVVSIAVFIIGGILLVR